MPRSWALHREVTEAKVYPLVPAVVLAQAWRGGSGPNMSRLLKGCHIVTEISEAQARSAGALCGHVGTSDVVDALVVILARQLGARLVVTGDEADLSVLRDAAGAAFELLRV